MEIHKENLLEELQSIKHCIGMTNSNIVHEKTRDHIVEVLEKRIAELQDEVDVTIATQEFSKLHLMDVA